MFNNIYLPIITGSSFEDPIVDMNDSSVNLVLQSDENEVNEDVLDDNDDGSEDDSDDEDDDHHSHVKKTPGFLCYIY